MTKSFKSILSTALLLMIFVSAVKPVMAASPSVYYCSHIQNIGWTGSVLNGQLSGTTGRSLRMEAMQIDLAGVSGGVTYRAHVQNIGWQEWKTNRQTAGTVGQSLRMEAVQIRLTGSAASLYDITYRVHGQNYGWTSWKKNGETAGTTGQSLRLEAIEIKLVKKTQAANNTTNNKNAAAAINWCNSQVGKRVGAGQCVDLIKAYYSYLGVTPATGNAYQYSSNSLPNGWKRVKGGIPQPGDILVYTGATYGHVAIYAGGNVSYHQNMSGKYVEKKTNWAYNKSWFSDNEKGTKSYWGYIRPNF